MIVWGSNMDWKTDWLCPTLQKGWLFLTHRCLIRTFHVFVHFAGFRRGRLSLLDMVHMWRKGRGECCPHTVANPMGQGQGMGPESAQVRGPRALQPSQELGRWPCPPQGSSGVQIAAGSQLQHPNTHPPWGSPVPDRKAEGTEPRHPQGGRGAQGCHSHEAHPLTWELLLHTWGSLGALSTLPPPSGITGRLLVLGGAGRVVWGMEMLQLSVPEGRRECPERTATWRGAGGRGAREGSGGVHEGVRRGACEGREGVRSAPEGWRKECRSAAPAHHRVCCGLVFDQFELLVPSLPSHWRQLGLAVLSAPCAALGVCFGPGHLPSLRLSSGPAGSSGRAPVFYELGSVPVCPVGSALPAVLLYWLCFSSLTFHHNPFIIPAQNSSISIKHCCA